jgi:hypothetical protein
LLIPALSFKTALEIELVDPGKNTTLDSNLGLINWGPENIPDAIAATTVTSNIGFFQR